MFGLSKSALPTPETALPGRDEVMPLPPGHFVHGRTLQAPFPASCEQILVGMGCFWGAERMFWQLPGVYSTAVGYAGGLTVIPPTRKYAVVVLVIQKWCSLFTIPNESN